jgi:peptidoglycan/LPS O-acetylase OafA/YrhL
MDPLTRDASLAFVSTSGTKGISLTARDQTPDSQVTPSLAKQEWGSKRIGSLDGIRAVSILFVVFGHAAATTSSPSARFLLSTFGDAEIGVSAFFVLSGYLITSLLLDEKTRTGAISLSGFYWRRAFRILPPFATLLVVLLILRGTHALTFLDSELLAAGLFIWNYAPWTASWWLGHTWSLSVEEQFYLCWPGTLRWLGRERAQRLALMLICCAPAVRVGTYLLFPALRGRIPIMAHTRVDTLMFGCWLALSRGRLDALEAFIKGRVRSSLPYLAIVVLALHTICGRRFGGRYALTLGFTLEGAALTAFLYSVLDDPTSYVARLLSLAPVTWLGRLSYSLYLWQQLFLTPANHTCLGRWPVNLFAAIVAAAMSYYAIEQPALEVGRRLRNRTPEGRASPKENG